MPLRVLQPPGASASHGWLADFLKQLDEQYRAIGMPRPSHLASLDATRDHPELLLYFATAPWDHAADPAFTESLTAYADDAPHLLPVINAEAEATTHLAPSLHRFNAFIADRFQQTFAEALVDEVLTLLWQRRRQRRIFISYRRSESRQMARQLHDHYTARSFDVFLDERSIEPGVDFQRELRRRLDDSDAVLLLVSPALTTSRWVREELQFATNRRIGLLGLVWPGAEGSATTLQLAPDQRVGLVQPAGAVVDRELNKTELTEVDRLLFLGRSRAVARRVTGLIDDAEHALQPELTITARRSDGDLELDRGGAPWRGRIAPFRPTPYDLWRWWDEIRKEPAAPAGIVVLYPQVDSSDPIERAFRAVCDAWGSRVTPLVELRPVHL